MQEGGGLRGWARVVISPPRLSSSLLSPRPRPVVPIPVPVPVPVPSSPPLSSPRPFRPRRPRVVLLSSTLDPPYKQGLVAVVAGLRPILVVIVPSSLSLSRPCCRCPLVLVLLSSCCPRPVVVVPLIPSLFPCSLFLIVWSLSCSLSPVAPTIHPVSSGSQQWGWVLGCFIVVVVLLFLVFWSSSHCRVPHRRPVVVILVPWYHLCRRHRRGRWPPLFVLEHPRSTLRAAAEWVLGGLRHPVVIVIISSFNYCLKKVS